mmetsp:Transcript_1057/g.2892  ORF Transcript_1057/g.2892 Transcript_1057/m.2892 type:complete len:370 (+) Transcript_1057:73-1182(+)
MRRTARTVAADASPRRRLRRPTACLSRRRGRRRCVQRRHGHMTSPAADAAHLGQQRTAVRPSRRRLREGRHRHGRRSRQATGTTHRRRHVTKRCRHAACKTCRCQNGKTKSRCCMGPGRRRNHRRPMGQSRWAPAAPFRRPPAGVTAQLRRSLATSSSRSGRSRRDGRSNRRRTVRTVPHSGEIPLRSLAACQHLPLCLKREKLPQRLRRGGNRHCRGSTCPHRQLRGSGRSLRIGCQRTAPSVVTTSAVHRAPPPAARGRHPRSERTLRLCQSSLRAVAARHAWRGRARLCSPRTCGGRPRHRTRCAAWRAQTRVEATTGRALRQRRARSSRTQRRASGGWRHRRIRRGNSDTEELDDVYKLRARFTR